MGNVDETSVQKKAFGEALDRALMAAGRTRAWLGAEVARICGKASPISQSAVSQWVAGNTDPDRLYVFAAEQALDLKPGSLSQLLGYLPVSARSVRTVPEAIDGDPALTPMARQMLRAAYREATRQP